MKRPGTQLRTLVSRVCSATTMERLVDPVIGDLQAEYADAIRDGRTGRRWGALIVGYVAFAKVFLLCVLYGATHAWRDWNTDDQRNLRRVLWRSGLITLAVAILFEMPDLLRLPQSVKISPDSRVSALIAYLIPAALGASVPVGVFLGTALGLNGRAPTRRLRSAVLLVAVAISAVSFVNLAWVIPAANQSYREEIIGGSVPKGERELSLIELRRAAEELRRWDAAHPEVGRERALERAQRASFAYHQRLALAGAPLTFTVLAIVLATRRRLGQRAMALAMCIAAASIIFVLMLGASLSKGGLVPPAIGAWLTHIVAVSAMVVVGIIGQGRLKAAPTNRIHA